MTGKLRVLILEDEWAARNYLTELIEASGLASVVAAAADTHQAWAALRAQNADFAIDVAFVDIRLAGEPSVNAGVAWLRDVKQSQAYAARFVLTTASRDHAIEAYELGVADYLVKPFTDERVNLCVRRLLAQQAPVGPQAALSPPSRIAARDGKRLIFIALDAVAAFEAADGLSYVYAAMGRYEVDLSLTALASVLGDGFVRVHRNWLANLAAVRTLERDGAETRLVIGDGELRVPVARDRATQVRDVLMASSVGIRRPPG